MSDTSSSNNFVGSTTTPTSTADGVSFLVLVTCWSGIYYHSVRHKYDFSKVHSLHNFHNGGAIALGLCSLGHLVPESIPIVWSLAYFTIDTVDCYRRNDITYLVHALFCAFLGLANYNHPMLYRLKMNSQASFCEFSNPFMHLAKRTRNPIHFALFAVVFTLCRIVWLPHMYRQLQRMGGLQYDHPIMIVFTLFYLLNWYWYYKILAILIGGLRKRGSAGGTVDTATTTTATKSGSKAA
jgi:TLC domain